MPKRSAGPVGVAIDRGRPGGRRSVHGRWASALAVITTRATPATRAARATRGSRATLTTLALTWALLAGAAAHAEAPARVGTPAASLAPSPTRFIGVEEVQPGMTGFGLTVFQGTRPDRFAVRVLGVLRNHLPQEDIILIQSDDPRLLHAGVVAGMSGSPIYIDGDGGPRLAGALAYGWHYAKDPVAGVTPIKNMVDELHRPLRGRERTPSLQAALEPKESGARVASAETDSLVPVSVPLVVSGFEPRAFEGLRDLLSTQGIEVVSGGGGATQGKATGPDHFEAGGAIAVQLMRGDMSASGTGTVTYLEGTRVAAFGHPMFNAGEIYLPIATAEIHTILASVASSFKMSSPLREIGSLVQDRQSCIVGDTAQRTDMIPMSVVVTEGGAPKRSFRVEVARHRFLTPSFAASVVANAAQASISDVADVSATVRTSIGIRGQKPLELTDHAFSIDGFSPRTMAGLSGMRAVGELLFNPFSPTSLERIDVQIDVEYRADVAEIVALQLGSDSLEPGTRPSLRVTLRPYNGAEYTESVPFEVPRSLAGQSLKIEAAAGHLAKPLVAPPERFDQFVDNLRRTYSARSVVVTVQAQDETLALRGSLLPNLPGSVLDTLRPGASTRRGEAFKESARLVIPTRQVVTGKQELQVKVKDESAR